MSNSKNKRSTYQKKDKKDYIKWIEEHHGDILKLPNNERVDYVFKNLNKDLGLNMTSKAIYQLLYRKGYIEHKKLIEESEDYPKIINEIYSSGVVEDQIKLNDDDYLYPGLVFNTQNLLMCIIQTLTISSLLIPNLNNFNEKDKPKIKKIIDTYSKIISLADDLKQIDRGLITINYKSCQPVLLDFNNFYNYQKQRESSEHHD